ncbi:helix-turn-helix domain-containing protein [Allosalinactinospora lopnorensis]|uniref:helix-turn-helix domain-containing protein n=1 Tax=Allosalinactinospora lopnorensis TaxID=1352348 RepID=UPI000623DEAF|nr:helix-turn-helix transcriptional regulator [Allosalinactinospora lopnorensis]
MIPVEDSAVAGRLHRDAQGGSTVVRILLGTQLRRLRTAKGISREDAGYAIRASRAKISRMELGQVRFKTRDVADLLTLYGVGDLQERATMLTLAECANVPGWWQDYEDVLPDWFEAYIGLEEGASIIRSYELQFVPGLLQTEDYARAVIQLSCVAASPTAEIDRRVAMRMRRQQRLIGPEPLRFWAVVDEAALRRPYGGTKVLRAQIEHLLTIAELPNVTLQVLPFAHGGHPAAGGPFSLLRFTAPQLSDVVYLEQLHSALYLDKRAETHRYLEIMEQLCIQAPPPSATPALLTAFYNDLA